jgi:hypothetical protein
MMRNLSVCLFMLVAGSAVADTAAQDKEKLEGL